MRKTSKAIADPDQMQLVPFNKVIVTLLSDGILCHARRKKPPYATFCQGAGSGVGRLRVSKPALPIAR